MSLSPDERADIRSRCDCLREDLDLLLSRIPLDSDEALAFRSMISNAAASINDLRWSNLVTPIEDDQPRS